MAQLLSLHSPPRYSFLLWEIVYKDILITKKETKFFKLKFSDLMSDVFIIVSYLYMPFVLTTTIYILRPMQTRRARSRCINNAAEDARPRQMALPTGL